MSEPLDWSYRTTEIPEAGLRQSRTATEAERAKVASMLEIVSCEQLTSEFVIRAIGQGHYRLAGKVAGQLTQNCVVTLDPLAQAVGGTFDVEFWPAGKQPASGEDEVEALSAAEIEPIQHGMIDAGRIVFETLSASVDPYPRKAGAEFKGDELNDAAELGDSGPFVALKKLKDRG
ncbi:MAG: YceD family protein [Hyphomicrobium sp.]